MDRIAFFTVDGAEHRVRRQEAVNRKEGKILDTRSWILVDSGSLIAGEGSRGRRAQIMRGKIISLILVLILLGCIDRPGTERVLFDFETKQDLDRVHWKCHALFSLSEEHATHGTRCLRMELYPSPYPGVTPMLRGNDWSEFRNLCFDIYNPQERETEIAVRIDDQKNWPEYPDRYNKSFRLLKGSNRIVIPLNTLVTSGAGRKMNLKRIQRFLLFMVNPPEKNVLYVDYISLVR